LTEFEKLRIVIGYEFLKHIRRKRLYIILALTLIAELAVLILVPTLGDGFPDNIMVMAALLSIGPSMATLGAIFFAGDAIAGEFENKTGFILFTNPVKRTTLVIGKYIACYVSVLLLIILGYVILTISLLAIYGSVPIETLSSFGLCLLYAGAVLSVTFFFSAVMKGSMSATVITLVFIMVISSIIDSVLMMTGQPHWFMLSTNGDSIATVYGGYEAFMEGFGGMGNMGDMPFEFETPSTSLSALSMSLYLVVCFVASLFFSNRRQLA
jgi:ABC-type transport system involved in multi-copper enzyme maturation permease subunit